MRKLYILITLFIAMHVVGLSIAAENSTAIAVVVSSKQNVKSLKLSTNNLNLIYWKKQRYWPKGLPIKPVNLSTKHPLRRSFSEGVLGSMPDAQIDYWNGQYFNGVLPPHSVDSEEAVIRYINKTKGAIGYIDACNVDQRVTPILWVVNHRITFQAPSQATCSH